MSQFCRIYCFTLLLVHLILIAVSDAQYFGFSATIQDENGIDMELKWTRTEQVLANQHLPIYEAKLNQPIKRNANIMEQIGNFETYYDLSKSSSVVFIQKSNLLFGVIGAKYLVIGLPITALNEKQIIGRSKYVIVAPLPTQPTSSSSSRAGPSAQDVSRLPLKKRPVVDANVGHPHLLDAKQRRPDLGDELNNATNVLLPMDLSRRGNIQEGYLSSHEFPSYKSEPDSLLGKMLAGSGQSPPSRDLIHNDSIKRTQTPADSSSPDANTLLKILLESSCKAIPEEGSRHLGNFFPEILIFVSYETGRALNRGQSVSGYSDEHVLYLIIYMNAVAMLFAKLKQDVNVRINIAGIVFENEEGAFPFSNPKFVNNQLVTRNGEPVLQSIQNFINFMRNSGPKRDSMFAEDSFDFFMFLTSFGYESEGTTASNENLRKYGVSTEVFSVMEQKSQPRPVKNLYMLGAAVDDSNTMRSFVHAAREIAHLLTVNDDYFESYSIMRTNDHESRNRCLYCLNWSSLSVQSFRDYFSWNKNRCLLLNEPRSLHQYNCPRRTLLPSTQCDCYSFETKFEERFTLNPLRSGSCTASLPCIVTSAARSAQSKKPQDVMQHILRISRTAPLPVDGTPCDIDKVCWQRKCEPTIR